MKKSKTEILFKNAESIYGENLKIVGDMYGKVFGKNGKFKYMLSEIYSDFDAYLQALLLKICHCSDDFTKVRMAFIENIAHFGKLLDGTDLTLFADCVSDIKAKLAEKAEARLSEMPICFKLSAAIDSGRDSGVTKILLDNTVKIAFNFKLLSADTVDDNSDIAAALKSVYTFLLAHGIRIK